MSAFRYEKFKQHHIYWIGFILFSFGMLCSYVSDEKSKGWKKLSNIPEPGRYFTFSFALDGKGYIVGGGIVDKHLKSVCTYDPTKRTWLTQPDFAGGTIYSPCGFVIDSVAYLVGGHDGTQASNKMYAFTTTSGKWVEVGVKSGKGVYDACGFSINGRGYIFGGSFGGPPYSNELWEFTPATKSWSKKAPMPASGRSACRAFVLNNEAYIISGLLYGDLESTTNEVWKYSPEKNEWKQMKNFAGGKRMGGETFSLLGFGYYSSGFSSVHEYNDLWRYDPVNDSWTDVGQYPGKRHWGGYVFTIGDTAFVGGGISSDELDVYRSSSRRCFSDFWCFVP